MKRWIQKPPLGVQINWAHPISRGLVGCWLMNEGSGNKIYDLSNNNNNGTFYGNTSWIPGKYGSCLDFDGSGDYVSLGSGVFQEVDNSPITVTAQIKAPVQSAVYGGILDHAQGSGPKGFGLALGNNGRLCFYNSGTQTWHTWLPTLDLDNQQWHFVAATLDQSGNLIFYADGEKSSPIISSLFNVSTAGAYIGAKYWYSIDGYFLGRIDHVMLFNRALTIAEIRQLYQEPFCIFGRKLFWSKV